MRVYAYLIVQKKGRIEDLDRLANEEKLISDYAANNSMLIAEWVRERDASRLRDMERRPALNRLLDQLHPGDVVIFPTFGTFATSPRDALEDSRELIDLGINLHFVDLGGEIFKQNKEVFFKIFETFANEPVPIKRLRSPKVRKIEEGEEYKGGVLPFGYRVDKKEYKLVDEKWRKEAQQKIKDIAQGIARSFGGDCLVDIPEGVPFVNNDSSLTDTISNLAKKMLGSENVVEMPIRMGAEDFSFYGHHCAASFFRLGTGNDKKGTTIPVHNPKFDIDEDALVIGSSAMAEMAMDLVK
jgi:DNA invertase Pin-like site-specific DNA recombinase